MKREKITLGWRMQDGQRPDSCPDEYVACAEEPMPVNEPVFVQNPLEIEPWITPEPLDICLDYWSTWMGKSDLDLDMQVGSDRDVRCSNPHQRRETEIAEAVDAMIQSLKPVERWAIYRSRGISTQWNFPNANFGDSVVQAERALEEKLRKNIATRSLF
jgi:hypothetical protein